MWLVCQHWTIAEKAWSWKLDFCPDSSLPNLSGQDLAYSPISKICPDIHMRAFFCPAMSRLADLALMLTQTMLRASQGVWNGYITSKMYILAKNTFISILIIRLLFSTMLFQEFQGCCELFSTNFQSFIKQCAKEDRILLSWDKNYCGKVALLY